MAKRETVGARELKTRLGTYLRRVRHGETLIVTERGEPTAELRPVPSGRSAEDLALARLHARGAISRRTRKSLSRFRAIVSPGGALSDAVIEDRQERF